MSVKLKPANWSNCDFGVVRCLTKNLPKFYFLMRKTQSSLVWGYSKDNMLLEEEVCREGFIFLPCNN